MALIQKYANFFWKYMNENELKINEWKESQEIYLHIYNQFITKKVPRTHNRKRKASLINYIGKTGYH